MYKLILVDDETEIREGLKEVIPFESLGFTVVGEAANGVEALAVCEQTEPDLVITDIRMPLMDGLTLLRRVRQEQPAAQFIILSGYDDFEYAKQAIEIKTMGYLLKPIGSAEFIAMLKDAKKQLDEEFSRRTDISRLREHFNSSLPMLRESLLCSLASGGEVVGNALEAAGKLQMRLQAPCYAMVMLRAERPCAEGGIKDDDLLSLAARNVLDEALQERGIRHELFTFEGVTSVLIMPESADELCYTRLLEQLEEARKTVRHYLTGATYMGVSERRATLHQLPMAAASARTALNQAVLSGQEQLLCITDIEQHALDEPIADEALLSSLTNGIKARDEALARRALDALLSVCERGGVSPRAWRAYLMEILMCFMRISSSLALKCDGLDERLAELMRESLATCPTVEEARRELAELLQMLLAAMESNRQTSSNLLAGEAERYLQAHYAEEDMSIERLCLHLHISPSYFSMVFKKERKKTFHQYLTDLRMDKALDLLSTTDDKIAGIAEAVGLPDPSYFSYCFKKHFGYPPSRARGR